MTTIQHGAALSWQRCLQPRATQLSSSRMKLSALLLTAVSTILISAVAADPSPIISKDAQTEDRAPSTVEADAKPAPRPTQGKTKAKVNIDKVDINTQELILQALTLIGVNYRYGGKSPETGLDCSGLVRYVFSQSMQMALPHNALAISKMGNTVDREELKPGDLVFFNTLRRQFSHVGIYMGDDLFIHAPSSGGGVSVVNMRDKYWQKRYNGARRITGNKDQ